MASLCSWLKRATRFSIALRLRSKRLCTLFFCFSRAKVSGTLQRWLSLVTSHSLPTDLGLYCGTWSPRPSDRSKQTHWKKYDILQPLSFILTIDIIIFIGIIIIPLKYIEQQKRSKTECIPSSIDGEVLFVLSPRFLFNLHKDFD